MSVDQMTKASDEEIIGLFDLLGSKSDNHPKDWLKEGQFRRHKPFKNLLKNIQIKPSDNL